MAGPSISCVFLAAAILTAGGQAPYNPELRPKPVNPPPARAAIEQAMHRGVAFLVKDQNADGSWGSAERTKDLNIYTPVPDGHMAYRSAVTALCVAALIETGGDNPEAKAALEKGEAWLLKSLPDVRRSSVDVLYNVWSHIYGIQALVRMHQRAAGNADRQKEIKKLIEQQYVMLDRFESIDGGWGYYDFRIGAQRPTTDSTSFMSAAALVAFYEAKQIGMPPREKTLKRADESIVRQRKPDFSYLYGEYLKWNPMGVINRPGGSLGRSQACNLALRLWGDAKITDDVLKTWLDRLISRNGWLDMGRKRPIPHESHFAVAGYFYYFGHYYAAMCIDELPAKERPFYQDHLATLLLNVQEKNGSWWDYPLYNYHFQYGTAFALMSLKRCLRQGQAAAAESAGD